MIKNKKSFYLLLLLLAVLFMGVGYASINSITADIKGTVKANVQSGVFIGDVEVGSNVDADLSLSKINATNKTLLNSTVVLSKSNSSSSITYNITFYNKSDIDYYFVETNYDKSFYDNDNITFTLNGLSKNDVIKKGKSITASITFSYLNKEDISSNILNSCINFEFKRVNTYMASAILNKYTENGEIDEVTSIDLDNMTKDEKKNMFSNISAASNLYRTKGITGKDVLVFRGNIEDNYVSLGGMLWRILRVDESGNLRLILDSAITATSKYNDTSSISSVENAKSVLGYENSVAKKTLDSWFNYLTSYQDKIVTSKFCNDFSYVSMTSSGSSNVTNYFKSYQNVGSDIGNYSPSLICDSSSIIEDSIGLISAEEYILAGGAFSKQNKSFFLYNSSITDSSWTLSPAFHDVGRKNGNVFIISENGELKDWSYGLLTSNYYLRPVITIDGNYKMNGDGTKNNPYSYEDSKVIGYKSDITDLSTLLNKKYFIGHTGGKKNVDGLLSNTLSGIGLLGKYTATFSDDKTRVINTSATPFTFVNGKKTDDGYLYQIKTDGGEYLSIGSDKSLILTTKETYLKVTLCTDENYKGRVVISNETSDMYLNFYGAESGSGDDKFAGWDTLDENAYMVMYEIE